MRMRPYLRVSDSKGGTSRSTTEQHADLGRDADDQEWELGQPYLDEGISASRYGGKVRGDYVRLLADLQTGQFQADILGLWEISRGSRQTREWLDLIDACEATRTEIWSHADERLYKPWVPGDRHALLSGAIDAERESSKTRQRSMRALTEGFAAGRPHGSVPVGYRRVYGDRREYLRTEVVPHEAAWIRHLYELIAAGRSLRSIATQFEAEGIRSREGRVLSTQVLRWTATRITYSGRRRLNGEVREAQWPAIVPLSLWTTVNRILGDPGRLTHRDGAAKWLLSGIALCGYCPGVITSGRTGGDEQPSYRCRHNEHVQINRQWLDAYAEQVILAYLTRHADALVAPDPDDPKIQRLENELADVQEQLDDLAAAVAARTITVTLAAKAEPPLREQAEQLRDQIQQLSVPPALAAIVAPGQQVADRWERAPMSARRAVARELLQPSMVGLLRVRRLPDQRWCQVDGCGKRMCLHQIERRIAWERGSS